MAYITPPPASQTVRGLTTVGTKAGNALLLAVDDTLPALALVASVEANTAGSGTPNVLLITESGKVLTNEGATAVNYHTLPTAVAGATFHVVCRLGTAAISAAAVTSITSSTTTATVTMASHGFTSGDYVTIAGADQVEYNGTYAITVSDPDVFTYTFAGSATTPATGTITAARVAQGIRITANTGDTIRLVANASAAAGYVQSVVTGSTVTLVAINATEWVALSVLGTWTVDS